MADQLTTVSKLRMISKLGKITPYELMKVELAIKIQLSLN